MICPPLGHEYVLAYESLRLLSDHLVMAGFAVLRFDYPGTGDSADADTPDADLFDPWLRSVSGSVGWSRRHVEGPCVLVGIRMGALLAAVDGDLLSEVDGCVLWDPCWTGRSFFRQHQALYQMLTGDTSARGVTSRRSIPGYTYPVATLDQLYHLDLERSAPRLPEHTLVLARDEQLRRRAAKVLVGGGMSVELVEGQHEMLDVGSPDSVVPTATVERIVRWCDERFDSKSKRLEAPPRIEPMVVGPRIVETVDHLGPQRLFSISTEPVDGAEGPTIIFVNVASEVHIGPARQWVELARRLSARGFRCVRIDLSGLGESPAREGEPRGRIFSPWALKDVEDALVALVGGDPRQAVVVGLCSGAYLALEAGATLGLAGVVSINATLDVDAAKTAGTSGLPGIDDDRVVVARPRAAIIAQAASMGWIRRLADLAPSSAWRIAHHLHLRRSPAEGLRAVTERAGRTLMLCDPTDADTYLRRGRWIIDRSLRQGTLTVEPVEVDHSLMTMPGRAIVADAAFNWLIGSFGHPAPVVEVGSPTSL